MLPSPYLEETPLSPNDPVNESTILLAPSSQLDGGNSDHHRSLRPPTPDDDCLNCARRILYASHCLNQFSEQTWQFCLVLILAAVTDYRSLFFVTSYGLVSYLAVCVAGSRVGRFLDETPRDRLTVAQWLILAQNGAVLGATGLCYVLLRDILDETRRTWRGELPTDVSSIMALAGIHFLGSVAAILDSGFTVAVERDWIVVMAGSMSNATHANMAKLCQRQKDWLSDTNVGMRQIDLSCKIVAPAVAGFFVQWFDSSGKANDILASDHGHDLRGAALLVGGLNSLALVVEYVCMAKVYNYIPVLGHTPSTSSSVPADTAHSNAANLASGQDITRRKRRSWWIQLLPDTHQLYFDQSPICWAGFSLSLLYLNVAMTFGGIMTSYLLWRGMGLGAIGFWRGIASAAGLTGTVLYHLMSSRMALVDVGMASVTFQFLCLSACYASLCFMDIGPSIIVLIVGVCLSRPGLWAFDIVVTQLMQECIPAPIRGSMGGVQQSMNAFFTLVAFSVGLFLSDPVYFQMYALFANVGVGLAVVFYACNVYYSRSQKLGK